MISKKMLTNLKMAVKNSRIEKMGYELVKNDAEAKVAAAVFNAYGDSSMGFIYISPSRARSHLRPPDIVLCHPEVGLLVIEVKGYSINKIKRLVAGDFVVQAGMKEKHINPFRQSENQMYEIKNDLERLTPDSRELPLLNAMVAFPNIRESEWREQGYHQAYPDKILLFQDHLETPEALRDRILQVVAESMAKTSKKQPLTKHQLDQIKKVFGNSNVINENRLPRIGIAPETLGAYIDKLTSAEKYLSEEQKKLSQLVVGRRPYLIRGVAGSGKSVVLACLVARYLHRRITSSNHSFPSIAVICFNRSLVSFLKKKIYTALREQGLQDFGKIENRLTVTHFNGLLKKLTKLHKEYLSYIPVEKVPDPAQRAKRYREQLTELAQHSPSMYQNICFDLIFVDEAQDFEPEEFRLMLDLIRPHRKTGEKSIVIFYDDAQNLYGRSRPTWKDIGLNLRGGRSQVMQRCFRNTRQIVELAFNVLLGARAPSSTQVYTRTYADLTYLIQNGLVKESNDYFHVNFTENNEGDPPEVNSFLLTMEEIAWVSRQIIWLINEQQVRPEDILILIPSKNFPYKEIQHRIKTELPNIEFVTPFNQHPDVDSYIFQPGKLTISTVQGAKGYDAPIVFLCGAEQFNLDSKGRATFYVGATRAKYKLYISGVNRVESTLLDEALAIAEELQ